ncbi:MAG: beta-galactosidase [Verrucomicrobiota bacterium]|nr:beta-galactosidase [Verrucomicrobiota bacterium]
MKVSSPLPVYASIKQWFILLLPALCCLVGTSYGAADSYSKYGGWKSLQGTATGYFHTQKINDRWWLVDPEGYAFISKGVSVVSSGGDYSPALGYSPYSRTLAEKYNNNTSLWVDATVQRLNKWGFNTIGTWSTSALWSKAPYVQILNLSRIVPAPTERVLFDVFNPLFAEKITATAQTACSPYINDPWLIGYCSDNELGWEVGADATKRVCVYYLELPAGSGGKTRLLQFLKEKYPTIEQLNAAWEIAFESYEALEANTTTLPLSNATFIADNVSFLKIAAARYFELCANAIKQYDPNHLYLGCRLAWPSDLLYPVVETMAGHADVISANNYQEKPFVNFLTEYTARTNLPVMITEFSVRGGDAPQPNTIGAGIVVNNQERRAKAYTTYVVTAINAPNIVGYHWFQYIDQPITGRSDGENSNYGLVNLQDEPWELLTNATTQLNFQLDALHNGQPIITMNPWLRHFDAQGTPITSESLKSQFEVTVTNGPVSWTATCTDSWITLTNATSGTGSMFYIKYKVSPNPNPVARTGTIWVNNQPFYVKQDAGSLFAADTTANLGGGWKWNKLGYVYDGYFPFVYIWSTQQWLYIFMPATEDGFFLYDFNLKQFGYTYRSAYPWYYPINGTSADPVNLNP